jgi:sulfite reductase alpha subunit-like flavoprotein
MESTSSRQERPLFLQVWIRPGTFGRLPLTLDEKRNFEVPMLCVGAGTGVAPLRALIMERDAVRSLSYRNSGNTPELLDENENILVFGCRKQDSDYYYEDEWRPLCEEKRMRILTAFSRDQFQKIYVQKVLREADAGTLISRHILERNGALYIAGGPKMARAVKEEVIEALGKVLQGGEKQANQLLNKLQRAGRFSIEAWS